MIFNSTHKFKDANATINDVLGKSYRFFESFKRGNLNSKKMIIEEVSFCFTQIMCFNYGYIKLNKIRNYNNLNKALKSYSYEIPNYQLHKHKT